MIVRVLSISAMMWSHLLTVGRSPSCFNNSKQSNTSQKQSSILDVEDEVSDHRVLQKGSTFWYPLSAKNDFNIFELSKGKINIDRIYRFPLQKKEEISFTRSTAFASSTESFIESRITRFVTWFMHHAWTMWRTLSFKHLTAPTSALVITEAVSVEQQTSLFGSRSILDKNPMTILLRTDPVSLVLPNSSAFW